MTSAILARRSTRSFQRRPLPNGAIAQLLEAARLAPSSRNRQPWRIAVVEDTNLKAEIVRLCDPGHEFVLDAPAVVVCCADLTVYNPKLRRAECAEAIRAEVQAMRDEAPERMTYWNALLTHPALRLSLVKSVASVSVAIIQMMLVATSLGLATCWVAEVGDDGEMEELLGLAATTVVVALVPVGYAEGEPPPRRRVPLEQIMIATVGSGQRGGPLTAFGRSTVSSEGQER